ncbi:MAG: DNA repair protein RecO [Halothiobacillaceae bacterium]|nr:MAG: DNA repair protein RecO [Halothiobacillaceae bacterium]
MSATRQGAGEEGYILHARPWRDTSLLLEVILREGGRRGVIARGARANHRQRGRLQPFRPLWLELAGRGELAQLRAVEEAGGMGPLSGRALACGYYLNELLMRLLPRDDPHPAIFDLYAETLARLTAGPPEAPALRRFETRLLEELGWAPDWLHCADGAPIHAEGLYHVAPESGIVPLSGGRDDGFKGIALRHLAEARFDDPASAREIRLILHGLMAPHLGPQPLRSRELLGMAAAPRA